MRHTIETAPKDGKFVILEDDETGTYDVAQWSPEAGKWVGKNSEPIKLAATHWHPLVRDQYLLREDELSGNRSAIWPSAWRSRKVLYAGATLGAGLLVFYAVRDAAQYDGVKIIGQLVSQATQLVSQGSKTFLPASLLTDANQTSPPAPQQVQVTSGQQARQSQIAERAEALAQELTEARQTIGRLDLQLREEAAKNLQSLEQERRQSATAALETAAARNELAAGSARYRQTLDEQGARSAALESELATAKSELETQAARLRTVNDEAAQLAHAEAAKNLQSLEQERKQSAALALEAATARNELAARSADYRQALQEESARTAALESELATAKSAIETQATRLRTVNNEAAQLAHAEAAKNLQSLEQERKQSAALAQEVATARNELSASSAGYRQALQEQGARAAALERELATAKSEIAAQATRLQASDEAGRLALAETAKNAELLEQKRKQSAALALDATSARTELAPSSLDFRQALKEESVRSAALESELATARREIETEAARLHAPANEREPLKQAPASTRAQLEQPLQQEWSRTAAVARDIKSGNTIAARAMPEPVKGGNMPNTARALDVFAPPQMTAAEAQGGTEATKLIARASTLLIQGDIGAARTVLESAAETGSARASFMLAETYDPAILAAWGTFGTRGEVVKARELYAKAHAGGIQEAKGRFDRLQQ